MKTYIFHTMKYDLKGQPRSSRKLLCQNMHNNANIMKTHFFMYDLECHFNVMKKFCIFFTLRQNNLITTLIYVLMDNSCLSF